MRELDYKTISIVIESWEKLRRLENYEEKAGVVLFKRVFHESPPAKTLFGFPIHADVTSPEILNSKRFKMHATYMIQMLDTALNMLGPDIELLTEILIELGEKHVRYGVKPEMFPVMGDALVHTLNECLGDDFPDEIREAWKETYIEISSDMLKAQLK
mmetsp:Transcript_6563/g.13078  ORF Transcript_6563/g.13078 Transcript_6563/m.13078 type:complete len:158 (+) Transcript_6563:160-633(+)